MVALANGENKGSVPYSVDYEDYTVFTFAGGMPNGSVQGSNSLDKPIAVQPKQRAIVYTDKGM